MPTSSPTSGRSSTSDAPGAPRRSPGELAGGLVRLVHPFPSLLDGAVAAAVALLAGGDPATSARLGLSMVALQASIGALNDLLDAPLDAGRKPGKPIPAGRVLPATARVVVVSSAGLGLVLAVPSGRVLVALAVVILAIGYGYDLWAKGTAWSWLPFALGIPLLPVYGWYGATGHLPSPFQILLPAAVAAGAALAIANARVDMERDADAGIDSVAIWLGSSRSWVAEAALLAAVALVGLGSSWARGVAAGTALALLAATGTIGVGVILGRQTTAARRERAWEVQAIGVALLAATWLAGARDLR